MRIEKEKIKMSFAEWEKAICEYTLPTWDNLPDIELYMDQVISLIEKYMKLYIEVMGSDKIITPAMINNYVKLGIIPSPVKKRYSKLHLAYLLIVCTLKQTLAISTIQRIIPQNLNEDEVIKIYNSFVENQNKAFVYVLDNTKTVANPIITYDGENSDRVNDLVLQVAASANILKLLTEKITEMTK